MSIKHAKRIVVKVGSSTITKKNFDMNTERIKQLAKVLSDVRKSGTEVVFVTSGAISAGISKIKLEERPKKIEEKQALAAIGQGELIGIYERYFGAEGQIIGQLLFTHDIVHNVKSRENALNTLETLLKMKCIPVINENDSVSYEEIVIGDNDRLSAYIAVLCRADALVLLSDVDGLYDDNPKTNPQAKFIHTVEKIDEKIRSYAGGSGSKMGIGGLITKIQAAEITVENGIPMYIVNGENPHDLRDLLSGKKVGTEFLAYSKGDEK